MTKNTFPFFDVDYGKLLNGFKVPGIDVNAVLDIQRKNFEAFAEAAQATAQGVQTAARSQGELMQKMISEYQDTAKELLEVSSPEANAVKQADLLKKNIEQGLGNLQELSDIVVKSQQEALTVISRRTVEAIEEFKAQIPAGEAK